MTAAICLVTVVATQYSRPKAAISSTLKSQCRLSTRTVISRIVHTSINSNAAIDTSNSLAGRYKVIKLI